MFYRVEVKEKDGFYDAVGESVKKDIIDLGFKNKIKEVRFVYVYLLEGDINESEVKKISEELFIDPITQEYAIKGNAALEKEFKVVEVAYNPGVMDPVEDSAKKAIQDLGIKGLCAVKTAKKYLLKGRLTNNEIHSIAEKVLYNKVIQHIVKGALAIYPEPPPYQFKLITIDILKASDKKLKDISKIGQLFLNLEEMRTIQKYFRKLKRNPTDCELETIAKTWSEHCKHKTLRGRIEYVEKGSLRHCEEREARRSPSTKARDFVLSKVEGRSNPKKRDCFAPSGLAMTTFQNPKLKIDNLLKSTIMKVTEELSKPWCVSVFKDNSGVIRFDEKYNVCFKVETHNHPSALEPYGGAGTGVGGVIRDPLGTGLGAKPIINTDVFCFGPPDYPYKKLPKGVLHPKRVMKGVVAGVRDYANRMGIPTSNGAVLFDERFVGNPLIFCGNVGILPKEKSLKKAKKSDLAVVVGGRTGRDGIHGATFSSGELTHKSRELSGSAVQIGNAITEKKMGDAILEARDRNLYHAITDCGAGGLSSAIGEMGEDLGVDVDLEKIPLKYKGLSYTESWISEAQERMTLAVDPEKIGELISVFEKENVEVTVIGRFTGNEHLRLFYRGQCVANLDMEFLHNGVPDSVRKAVWEKLRYKEPVIKNKKDLTKDLVLLLSTLNIASKEWIIRQYDHEVQGGSVLKPLQGIKNDGPGDACVTRPILSSKKGIILSCGINPDYGKIDPYWMAASVIDEALRQVVAVGGDIQKCAILDNFCWGNTEKSDRLGGLVRAAMACYDIAKAYGVPFISGKDSLNNEYSTGKEIIAIPPTLLISAIAVMDDVSKAITMDAKKAGHPIYMAGLTGDELGGSQYYKMMGFIGNNVPRVDPTYGKRMMIGLRNAIKSGAVAACHDCSDGGAAVALAEMAFAGGLGMEIKLGNFNRPKTQILFQDEVLLFSESNTRFIVEAADEKKFVRLMGDLPIWKLGHVKNDRTFKIFGGCGKLKINTEIDRLKASWQAPFKKL